MGDMGDYWRDIKEARKGSKVDFIEKVIPKHIKKIEQLGAIVKEQNSISEQYRVHFNNECLDWWATTGTWISRTTKGHRGDSLKSMLSYIEKNIKP